MMDELIEGLKYRGVLKSKRIENSLRKIDRAYFVPDELRTYAYADTALPIGDGQTISQPYTVVFMLELLDVKSGNNVLEVGFGSGWQTAILADLVEEAGAVFSMEIVPELFEFGKVNISRYTHINKRVEFYLKNAQQGLPDISQRIDGFDRIISGADMKYIPIEWRDQLKNGGTMVYPMNEGIYKEVKVSQEPI